MSRRTCGSRANPTCARARARGARARALCGVFARPCASCKGSYSLRVLCSSPCRVPFARVRASRFACLRHLYSHFRADTEAHNAPPRSLALVAVWWPRARVHLLLYAFEVVS